MTKSGETHTGDRPNGAPSSMITTPTGYNDYMHHVHEGHSFDLYFYDDHVIMLADRKTKVKFSNEEFMTKFATFAASRNMEGK